MQVPLSKASNPLNLLHSQQHIQKLSANLRKAFIALPCFLLHPLTPTLGVNINVLLTRRLALAHTSVSTAEVKNMYILLPAGFRLPGRSIPSMCRVLKWRARRVSISRNLLQFLFLFFFPSMYLNFLCLVYFFSYLCFPTLTLCGTDSVSVNPL